MNSQHYGYKEKIRTRRLRNCKVGDKLKVVTVNNKGEKIGEVYRIKKVYPFFVEAVCGSKKKCFNLGDLVMCGAEQSMLDI